MMPPAARHVLIVHNRTAGADSGELRVGRLAHQLRSHQLQIQTLDRPDSLRQTIAQIGLDHVRAVVAAGGDGTVSATVHHAPPGTPIAVLPLGTENLLAKYLGHRRDTSYLVDLILNGWTVKLDAGQANGRSFLLMAGCGFDAEVVRRLHASRRGHIRHWSYLKPIWQTIRSYKYPPLRVYCEPVEPQPGSGTSPDRAEPAEPQRPGQPWAMARWAFVINLPRYARGLSFAPLAVGTDGLLDVCTFRRGSLARSLWYLAGVLTGRHHRWADVSHCQARQVWIESDQPVPFQVDGDPGGQLPLHLSVVPGRLRVLVSRQWAARQGIAQAELER
jgi:diacylglycerol kinase family enzyme